MKEVIFLFPLHPVFLLIAIYGDSRKEKASLKFFVYTQIGSVFLLLSILTLFSYYGSSHGNVFTLNMSTLLNPSFIIIDMSSAIIETVV